MEDMKQIKNVTVRQTKKRPCILEISYCSREKFLFYEKIIDTVVLCSLSVAIVGLININRWPYLSINNFQLMDETRSIALTPRMHLVVALQI